MTTHTAVRRAIRALVLVAVFAALLVSAGPGAAAQSCGRKVLDDWYDGRVDGTYALHCYDDAIEIIPRDVRDYSSAEDDIKRALQAAMRGEPAPPNKNGPPSQDEQPPDDKPGATPPATPPGSDPPSDADALPPVGESASSIPIPLLVLAGLALLLVLGGAAGYAVRRIQNRRVPPPAL